MRAAELAPATIGGQLAAYLEIIFAIGLASAWLDRPSVFVVGAAALGIGVVVGIATPIGSRLTKVSGVVLSLCGVFVLAMVHALTDGRLLGDEPWLAFLAVALVPIGLDWRVAARLRARTVCSGILIVPLVGAKEDWAYVGAVVWFVGALVTLWLLERDIRNATMRPVPLTPGEPGGRANIMEVVRTAGIGLGLGLVIALLFADVRCTAPTSGPRFDVSGGSTPFDPRGSATPGSSGSSPRIAPPMRDLDGGGHEYQYRVDEQGRRYVSGADGNRVFVDEEGDRTVLRRDNGDTVAEIDENGITAYDADGDAQSYTRRSDGRYELEGTNGERYTLGLEGGRWVLRDGSGSEVTGTDPQASLSPDHLYVRDPEGNVLIPDRDDDARIPLPPSGGAGEPTGPDRGLVYGRDDDGRVVVRDPDGSTRTYDRDGEGNDRVRVDDWNGTRTYVYDESGDSVRISEYDQSGRHIGAYLFDSEGRLIDESQRAVGGSSGGGSAASSAAPRPQDAGGRETPWLWIIGGIVLVAAVVTALVLLMRRPRGSRRELDWAERLSARLDVEGRRRGRGRDRSETVSAHAAALAGGPLPDPRLVTVGQMVSAALFGRRQPPAAARTWAEGVVDEASRAHPPPPRRSRWSRRRTSRTGA
jgi:hypothetical protein